MVFVSIVISTYHMDIESSNELLRCFKSSKTEFRTPTKSIECWFCEKNNQSVFRIGMVE
jgi:hypothetical protein